jgi:nucleoside-triphosphatase THEP1
MAALSPDAGPEYQGRNRQQGADMTALAYVMAEGRGAGDRLLAGVAARLQAEGVRLAGVVQTNTDLPGLTRCDMDLQVLGRPETVRISQRLGAAAKGCRLDPDGLETAVGLVETALEGAQLLLINKFGKAEIEGRGFRALIGQALALEVPVLLGLKPENRAGFEAFAEGMAEGLPAEENAVLHWCRQNLS